MLTAALNWYRAFFLTDVRGIGEKITVPTMYVWSDGDAALLERVLATLGVTSAANTASRSCTGHTGCSMSSPPQ